MEVAHKLSVRDSRMLIERSLHPQFLSNTYLVAPSLRDQAGRAAIFIDAGGPVGPLLDAAQRLHLRPTHLLLTHHHYDHVCEAARLRSHYPELVVLMHPTELAMLEEEIGARPLAPDATIEVEGLEVRALHTPGHTAGMLSFHIRDRHDGQEAVFTGDTLFKGSVGGVHASGHTTFADLRHSIMERLMGLSREVVIYPGHAEPTTVGAEWEENPFIRRWRGLEGGQPRPCLALGKEAELVLLAKDYDGGTKAWVRWPDGKDDILPGSRVEVR
jgi:hydroxyacylglutathione hydrolase